MFTIKQLTRDINLSKSAMTRLWEGQNVQCSINENTGKAQVEFQMPDGVTCSIDTGLIYVMNHHGKTVDTFRLEGSEWY